MGALSSEGLTKGTPCLHHRRLTPVFCKGMPVSGVGRNCNVSWVVRQMTRHVDSLSTDHVCKCTPHPICFGPTATRVIVIKAGINGEGLRVQNMQGWKKTCISWEQQQCGGKRSLFRKMIRLHSVTFYFLLPRGRNSGGNLIKPICSNHTFECRGHIFDCPLNENTQISEI